MAGLTPKFNDRDYDLWKKAAWNIYEFSVNFGVTGLNPPSWNDKTFDLQKKMVKATAAFVDHHV